MLTHYAKRRPRGESHTFHDVLGSLVYSLAPEDRLITKSEIINSIYAYYENHRDEVRGLTRREVDLSAAVDRLTKSGHFKEVNGTRLARFLDSF